MINIRDLYDTWKLDQSPDNQDLPLLEALSIRYFGMTNSDNYQSNFDYSNNGICRDFKNIKKYIFEYERFIDQNTIEPIFGINVSNVSDNLCDILWYCEGFYKNDYKDCITTLIIYSIRFVNYISLRIKTISKYCYNFQVIYFILKGYLNELFKYIKDLNAHDQIVEQLAKSILMLIDAIDKSNSETNDTTVVLYDLKNYFIKERDTIYLLMRRKDEQND